MVGDLSLLFVAHRRRILDQSRATFATVMKDPDFGEILGRRTGAADWTARLRDGAVAAQRGCLEAMAPDAYDVVVIDEVHHAAAPSYRALLEHLQPKELLGLTATPERMDGQDVTRWFGDRDRRGAAPVGGDRRRITSRRSSTSASTTTSTCRPLSGVEADIAPTISTRLFTGDDMRVNRLVQALERVLLDPGSMRALGFCVSVAHADFMAEIVLRARPPGRCSVCGRRERRSATPCFVAWSAATCDACSLSTCSEKASTFHR